MSNSFEVRHNPTTTGTVMAAQGCQHWQHKTKRASDVFGVREEKVPPCTAITSIENSLVIPLRGFTQTGPAMASLIQSQLDSPDIDGIIYVSGSLTSGPAPFLDQAIKNASELDKSFSSHVSVIAVPLPAKRLIFCPVGKQTDYDDVRSYAETATKGMKRALAVGVKRPLLLLEESAPYERADFATLLGALEALYTPLQLREAGKEGPKLAKLAVATDKGGDVSALLKLATVIEEGRWIARDIGGSDPERMPPPMVEKYVLEQFKGVDNVKIEVISDEKVFEKEYPCFAAVNRAASVIDRYKGRIIYLRYEPKTAVKQSLYLVGKGITYDTGGSDIKIQGKMVGMSRDKCGAAAVAGFMKIVSRVAPEGLRVVGALCVARNSVGENAYVADEVITARSGVRIRVGNTDAEGRMVMADVLCKLKEEAVNDQDAHLLTIATLTGHAVLSVGPYTIAVDNSVAHSLEKARTLKRIGQHLADPFEESILRREDFAKHVGRAEGDDLHQSGSMPSAKLQRGHQGPTAFMLVSSGLDKHGLNSEKPLKYTHLDIAGSAGDLPDETRAVPIISLYASFLYNNVTHVYPLLPKKM